MILNPKPIILIDMPFCNQKEKISRWLLKKLKTFTKEKFDFKIVWKTKKSKQLFPLKEKNPYPSCKICEGVCSCKENYRWDERQCNYLLEWALKSKQRFWSSQAPLSTPWSCFSMESSDVSTYEYLQKKKLGGILYSSETSNLIKWTQRFKETNAV